MKKWISLLLALLLIASLCACGKDEPSISGALDGKVTTPSTAAPTTAATEPKPTEPEVQLTNLTTTFFSLDYSEDDGWTYEEEDLRSYESYADLEIIIPTEEGETYRVWAYITCDLEDPYRFRDKLKSYGFDQYEYKVNHAYDSEMVSIGGISFLEYNGSYWGEDNRIYLARAEEAKTTILIDILGEVDDPAVSALLSGLNFNLTDIGNVDGPWYWEGTPFYTEDHSTMVGTYTLSAQWLPFEPLVMTEETFDHDIAVVGSKAYVLVDGLLKEYDYDGSSLSYVRDIALDDEYERIESCADGMLHVSGFASDYLILNDGEVTGAYDGPDKLAMHPSGTWGVSFFVSGECEKYDFSSGAPVVTPITFAEVSTISTIYLDNSYIYVSGAAADSSGSKIFVYDANGTLQFTLAGQDDSSLGSVTFVAHTANGFLALDANMREVVLWTEDGQWIGTADDRDLFGTDYPWFCSAQIQSDGSILVVMTDERADRSADELIAFRLTGF